MTNNNGLTPIQGPRWHFPCTKQKNKTSPNPLDIVSHKATAFQARKVFVSSSSTEEAGLTVHNVKKHDLKSHNKTMEPSAVSSWVGRMRASLGQLLGRFCTTITKIKGASLRFMTSLVHNNLRETNFGNTQKTQSSPLEEKMISLANIVEEIANRSKTLCDIYVLKLEPGETAEQVAEEFVSSLLNASQLNPPMSSFTFKDKTIDVEQTYRSTMEALNRGFQGNESLQWKEGLLEHISSKHATTEGKIHISKLLREAIDNIKTQEDVEQIAFLLMSEVTTNKGRIRKLNLNKLKTLLINPKIDGSSRLKNAVLEAAKSVQLRAMQKAQENVVAEALSHNKPLWVAWEIQANLPGRSDKHLGVQGIYAIAAEAGITLPLNIGEGIALDEVKVLDSLQSEFREFKELASSGTSW